MFPPRFRNTETCAFRAVYVATGPLLLKFLHNKTTSHYVLHICFDSFGCKYRSKITGIVYNNEMGDFATPGQLNPDDIKPSKSNFIKPGKRPQSSISPVIFTDASGRVRLVAGASGGPLITTAVSLVSFILSCSQRLLLLLSCSQRLPTLVICH